MKKKLLYIPLDYHRHTEDPMLFTDFLHAFQTKFDARIFTTMDEAVEFKPDFVFFQGSLIETDLYYLKMKTGAKIFMWTGDCRYAPTKSLMDYRNIVDTYLLPFSGILLSEYQLILGKPCHYLFEPIQNWRFREPKEMNSGKIVFVGNHYGNVPGGESRMEIIKHINQHLPNELEVYGNIEGSKGTIDYKDVPDLYNNAYIVICENKWHDVGGYFTPRNLGAMAVGSCPLMRYFPNLDNRFGHLSDCLVYKNKYELLDYILLLKENPSIRNHISTNAFYSANTKWKAEHFAEKFYDKTNR